MATCKNCFHYEACLAFSKIINSARDVEKGCELFKNRKDVMDVSMENIIFQGQRLDNGEWVKGDLFHNDNFQFPMVLIGHVIMSRNKYTNALSFDGFDLCEVDPKTVSVVSDTKEPGMDKMKQIYELARSVSIEEVRAALKGAKTKEEKLLYCCVQLISQMDMGDEGQRIQEEYERDLAAGKVPEVPEALDQKCRKIIENHFRTAK